MTIEDLHRDEKLRHNQFPITAAKIYLAHAGVCPFPARVRDAIAHYSEGCTLSDQECVYPTSWLRETRELAAKFLAVKREEVAFVGPTSLGLSFVAEGLKFRKHQNVVIYHDDYPSNVYPWMTLSNRGVQVRFLNIRDYGSIRVRDVLGQIDESTRLVALASCHFLAGYRVNLEEMGKQLRSRGILFCVDAIQTLGAFPTPLEYVDFAAADAHKWLLGPCSAGLFYVRKEVQDQLRPTTHGWHNIRNPDYVAQEDMEYKTDARKYEAGSHNLLGIAGLRAGLELLGEIGIDAISRDLLRKRAWLVPALQEKGYSVLHANSTVENMGPITTFFKPDTDMGEIHRKLEQEGIITSLRTDRRQQRYIRLAPHFYNTDDELRRVIDLL